MQLQASPASEKDALKELRKALSAGNAATVVSTHSDEARKSLVRFTLAQVRPRWVGYHIVPDTETRVATMGYLALATLKQPEAEKPDRRGLHSITHTNLRAAIEEYLEAMARL